MTGRSMLGYRKLVATLYTVTLAGALRWAGMIDPEAFRSIVIVVVPAFLAANALQGASTAGKSGAGAVE